MHARTIWRICLAHQRSTTADRVSSLVFVNNLEPTPAANRGKAFVGSEQTFDALGRLIFLRPRSTMRRRSMSSSGAFSPDAALGQDTVSPACSQGGSPKIDLKTPPNPNEVPGAQSASAACHAAPVRRASHCNRLSTRPDIPPREERNPRIGLLGRANGVPLGLPRLASHDASPPQGPAGLAPLYEDDLPVAADLSSAHELAPISPEDSCDASRRLTPHGPSVISSPTRCSSSARVAFDPAHDEDNICGSRGSAASSEGSERRQTRASTSSNLHVTPPGAALGFSPPAPPKPPVKTSRLSAMGPFPIGAASRSYALRPRSTAQGAASAARQGGCLPSDPSDPSDVDEGMDEALCAGGPYGMQPPGEVGAAPTAGDGLEDPSIDLCESTLTQAMKSMSHLSINLFKDVHGLPEHPNEVPTVAVYTSRAAKKRADEAGTVAATHSQAPALATASRMRAMVDETGTALPTPRSTPIHDDEARACHSEPTPVATPLEAVNASWYPEANGDVIMTTEEMAKAPSYISVGVPIDMAHPEGLAETQGLSRGLAQTAPASGLIKLGTHNGPTPATNAPPPAGGAAQVAPEGVGLKRSVTRPRNLHVWTEQEQLGTSAALAMAEAAHEEEAATTVISHDMPDLATSSATITTRPTTRLVSKETTTTIKEYVAGQEPKVTIVKKRTVSSETETEQVRVAHRQAAAARASPSRDRHFRPPTPSRPPATLPADSRPCPPPVWCPPHVRLSPPGAAQKGQAAQHAGQCCRGQGGQPLF